MFAKCEHGTFENVRYTETDLWERRIMMRTSGTGHWQGGENAKTRLLTRESVLLVLVEQILPPLIVAFREQAHQVAAGMQTERTWRARQLHSGFFGRAAALAIVAGWQQATKFSQAVSPARERGDHVIPASTRPTAWCDGNIGRYNGRASKYSCAKEPGSDAECGGIPAAGSRTNSNGMARRMDVRLRFFLRRRDAFQH